MANSAIDKIKIGTVVYDIKPATAYQDTDTKVKQNLVTAGEKPVLLASAATPTTAAGEVYQNSGLKYSADSGILTAKNGFKTETGTAEQFLMANGTVTTMSPLTVSAVSGTSVGVNYEDGKMTFTIPAGVGIGTVTATASSVASSADPAVTVTTATSGNNKNCTFAFSIPKGSNGTNGSGVGTVAATVASVASNVAPTVTVTTAASGTDKNVTMAFKLPKGDTGATGVVSVVTAGSGNAVTSGSYDSSTKTITFTKGSSFLASNGTAVCASLLDGGVTEVGANTKQSTTSTANDAYDPNLLDVSKIQILHNYGLWSTGWKHMPPLSSFGHVLNMGCKHTSLASQFAMLLDTPPNYQVTGKLFWRMVDKINGNDALTDSTKNYNWKQIVTNDMLEGTYLPLTGGTCTGSITAPAFYQSSDARKKDIIGNLDLDKCISLMDCCNKVVYKLKGDDKEQIGMIAQEVEEWFPEIVTTDEDGYKSLDYSRLTVICLRLIKDLYDKVSSLNSYINEYK